MKRNHQGLAVVRQLTPGHLVDKVRIRSTTFHKMHLFNPDKSTVEVFSSFFRAYCAMPQIAQGTPVSMDISSHPLAPIRTLLASTMSSDCAALNRESLNTRSALRPGTITLPEPPDVKHLSRISEQAVLSADKQKPRARSKFFVPRSPPEILLPVVGLICRALHARAGIADKRFQQKFLTSLAGNPLFLNGHLQSSWL
ncbi:uncharacterized protein BT62DRAFT_1005298 [Guyanagaster necrorhizus]|uniref:Uncharacterized protein n=1 Tax=Guyanagaster necrorhizus TaxID=856835 RepID=A0A9P8ATE3_9AGAR|nr:uncharacterized protein BT62DRAFT_1005298 [Guyanagaster necrorhizus MCA 3950]KAG7446901.1 hypothetical protein BT62DRAFT_1005298 [Guyanagaster necrorhizus MCA 3950]